MFPILLGWVEGDEDTLVHITNSACKAANQMSSGLFFKYYLGFWDIGFWLMAYMW